MKRRLASALSAAALMAASAVGAEMKVGEAEITFGSPGALWQEVRLGGRVYSNFARRESGRLLDTSRSKAAELTAAVKRLSLRDACKLTRGRSKVGDETYTLENGVVKVVIVPAFGGRIIEISNKATGANIFMDNYQDAQNRPEKGDRRPKPSVGGYIEALTRNPGRDRNSWKAEHKVDLQKRSADELVVRTSADVEINTWEVPGPVTVERTIGLKRGSAVVSLGVRLTNHSGQREREFRFHQDTAFALGGSLDGDEFWLSSLGYVAHLPGHAGGDAYCTVHVEDGTDTWQSIIDRAAREGVALLVGGEIFGRLDVYRGKERYSYQNSSTLREHVVEGSTIEVRQDFAPVLNFDAVSFACPDAVVCFHPQKVRVAPGETVGAVAAAAMISGGRPGRITLTPRLVTRSGESSAEMRAVTIDAPFLVAGPKKVEFTVPPSVRSGRYDLVVDVGGPGGNRLGSIRHRMFVSDAAGVYLSVLRPTDDGYGRGLSVTGTLERARVLVARAGAEGSSGTFEVAGAGLPWVTKTSEAGGALKVELTTDFSRLPPGALIQSYGLTFPVNVGDNESNKAVVAAHRLRWEHAKVLRTTIGGDSRDDQYMLDQARNTREQDIPHYYLSDGANRMPQWRYGGVLQTAPTNSWIWKAAGDDVAPVAVQTERSAAGWVNLHSPRIGQGVLVCVPGMAAAAPKGIVADGEAGTVSIDFFPPHVPAMGLGKAGREGRSRAEIWGLGPEGKATFTAFIRFHTEDLAGDLTKVGNKAQKIRGIVKGME